MTNIYEKVARAIFLGRNGKWNYNKYKSDPRFSEAYRADAKAVIEALGVIVLEKGADPQVGDVITYALNNQRGEAFFMAGIVSDLILTQQFMSSMSGLKIIQRNGTPVIYREG